MAESPRRDQTDTVFRGGYEPFEHQLSRVEGLYRSGKVTEAIESATSVVTTNLKAEEHARLLLALGVALFDLGDVTASLDRLRDASQHAKHHISTHFEIAFSLFLRVSDFEGPTGLLPGLTELRQLAWKLGDARSLGALHLAVARLEGLRGNCRDAHRHLQISRRLVEHNPNGSLLCSLDQVEGSLESTAGNLARSRFLAERCLDRAKTLGFSKYVLGSVANLASAATALGQTSPSRRYLMEVIARADSITYVKLGTLDSLAQVELFEDKPTECSKWLSQCARVIGADRLPSRSWTDFSHQLTRCAYYERLEQWDAVLDICADVDPELERRQYRALRTSLLCARARALGRSGQHQQAQSTLALAVRVCPRGAVDPLIVLEASKAICLTLQGDRAAGAVHFDRALAACRAIDHRYHERWIDRDRAALDASAKDQVVVPRRQIDTTAAALLLTDASTIIGAGHSIDLLAHRTATLLENTLPLSQVEVTSESGCDYQAEPSATSQIDADGSVELGLRGSDRRVVIKVRNLKDLGEISIVKSVTDLAQAAVQRADGAEQEGDETLWPRTLLAPGEDVDTIFRTPRMTELVTIAIRLAATDLPVLITGETGTGKEVFARLIHEHSRVKRGPFVPFNCSSVPKDLAESQLFGHRRGAFTGASEASQGVIRAADRGTLFLDEVGELDLMTQPKLLRFLESGEVHPVGEARPVHVGVRVVAATNAEVDDLVKQGRFRADLFYRLGVAKLTLPPLRERKDEIPALAALFLSRYSRECQRKGLRLGDDFVAALLLYDWPGNIRELSNEIRRAVAMASDGESLTSANLAGPIADCWNSRTPAPTAPTGTGFYVSLEQTLPQAIAELEDRFIQHAITATGGCVTDAAQLLGLSRKGLFLKRRRRGMVGASDDIESTA